MSLTAGDRLGPYEIVALIGAGGMGEVYRARDTRIGRDVAVKVSAERFSDRFNREARVIASLNHPNICTLHDVGPNYLVMELVGGPTLAERIQEGPIPLEAALTIARQIADALEAAHEKGMVHRDLKPGNVKIKPDGVVKVLDFGLAKVVQAVAGEPDPAASPTLTMLATEAGVILGTAAYMPPEQARGKPVDKRADIWAFGVVLYEMLTGRRLFQGGDVTDTLAAVIKDEPRWDAVPARVRPLLRRCLEKDPKKRLRDIGDAMALLEVVPEAPAPVRVRRQWLWPAVAALGFLAAAGLAFVYFREKPSAAEQMRFQIPLPGGPHLVVISPNGRRLAFDVAGPDGRPAIWVREMDSLEPHRLAGTEDTRGVFFWSPDSRLIAFQTAGKLEKIDAAGGLPQVICDVSDTVIGGSWSRAGTILVSSKGIKRVSDSGGTPVQVTTTGDSLFPSFLPDGRHFVYFFPATPDNKPGIYLGSLDARPDQQASRHLLATNLHAQYVPSADPGLGYILFLRGTALLAQPFDNRRLETAGEAIPIAERVGSFAASGLFSASENGVLTYRGGSGSVNQLTWYDRQGKALGTTGEPGLYSGVALSPDGSRVATNRFSRQEEGLAFGILLLDFSRGGVSTHLTFSSGLNLAPVWSPDGGRIVFNRGILYEKPSSGTGSEAVLLDRPAYPTDWSRDGRYLLYEEIDPKTGHDLWSLPNPGGSSADRKPLPVLNSPFNEPMGQFSPDAHWIAYVSDESGRPEIYVQPFPPSPSGGIKRTISQGGGDQPRWRRDGRELLFLAPDGTLMSVDVSTSGPTFTASIPRPLFRAPVVTTEIAGPPAFHWDVSADGKKFLLDVNVDGPSEPVTIFSNWLAQLKK